LNALLVVSGIIGATILF